MDVVENVMVLPNLIHTANKYIRNLILYSPGRGLRKLLTIHRHQEFFQVEELNSKYDKPCHIHRTAVGHLGSPFHHTVRRQMNKTDKFWLTHSE